ncbi:MAG: UDP-3-O-(3-hydroxymyristoyl)glucosamine N-acyltransferase [Pseudanabaenaceae cyanobacterium]
MKFSALLTQLGIDPQTAHLAGDPDLTGVAPLGTAQPDQLSFLENRQFLSQLQTTKAGALFLPQDDRLQGWLGEHPTTAYLLTPQPRLLFAQAIAIFHPPQKPPQGVHPTAVIDPTAVVPDSAYIGAHAVLGAGVVLGADVQVHANCTVYEGVQIGDRTVVYANVVLHPHTLIGADCVIHSGAVIGGEGFGFVPTATGQWLKMPQVGKVVIEDQVEIGGNTCIDRGAIGETRIGKGTKIDNLVQIGHGCTIGKNCILAGQVGLAGGVTVGDQVILAGQVGVNNHIHIGDRTSVAAQSGILDSVPPGAQIMGYPAFDVKEFFKAVAVFKRLPELQKKLRELQKQVQTLLHNPEL